MENNFILEKLVDGEWYLWGIYDNPEIMAKAAFSLGRNASLVENVRVRVEPKENKEA